MPIDGRFPMYPGRAVGFLYGRGPSTVVLWADDYIVEESPTGSTTPDDLDSFEQLMREIRRDIRPRSMAVAHDSILAAGWGDRGMLSYEVQSGLLLIQADALTDMADELWHEREQMLAHAGGRHPEVGSVTWPQWITVTVRRAATVRGARALGLAAVESLVNELLAAQHPDEFAEWETKQRKGFRSKLVSLLELHGLDADDLEWFENLDREAKLRNRMIHHSPRWVIDESDEHSVAPDDDMTQEALHETLAVVRQAVGELFALYGVQTPETHQPEWIERATRW